jgi:hypothetical protein
MRNAVIIVLALIALWFATLVVLDFALADRQARHVSDRLGESLQANATIDAADLALVRGSLSLTGLALRRDDTVGHLAIDVGEVRCELPPLGWALVDGGCRELAVRGTRLEVSSAALFQIKNPKRAPITADRVVIDDAQLAFAPSAFVPSLGKIAISIEHAEAGHTVFRTPLSWLFSVRELSARIDLPASISVHLRYHEGRLAAAGTLFGSSPVEIPITIPIAAKDAHEEIAQLVQLGEDIAARLVEARAVDWLHSKLH